MTKFLRDWRFCFSAYLELADYSIREEMVLKTAILSEKYATDYNWYVDVVLQLIRIAGDYVSDEVWHRVVQVLFKIFNFLEHFFWNIYTRKIAQIKGYKMNLYVQLEFATRKRSNQQWTNQFKKRWWQIVKTFKATRQRLFSKRSKHPPATRTWSK